MLRTMTILIALAVYAGSALAGERIAPLVGADWLAERLDDDPDLVVLDTTVLPGRDGDGRVTTTSGRRQFEENHIPGAAFADLTGNLADAASDLRYALPAPEAFARAMETLGVSDDSVVVLYDSAGSMWAARVWWMLRWIGFDNAAILDGGLEAWRSAGYPLSDAPSTPETGSLTVRLRPELIVDEAEVRAAIDDEDVEIIDALAAEHYRGETSSYPRAGHIATASNVPVYSVLDADGRFRSKAELEALFSAADGKRAIHYCGAGIASSGTAFAMTLAGFDDVAVYTNSLQEWTADPSNPMETVTDER